LVITGRRDGVGENAGVLDDVIRYLRCPYCGACVCRDGGSLRCAAGHVFDIARQGYVSLLPAGARGDHGDSAAMVQARADFLAAGHYAGIAAELVRAAAEVMAGMRHRRWRGHRLLPCGRD
jgi:23S rRNA (guanine745-N1)-methyltransferase